MSAWPPGPSSAEFQSCAFPELTAKANDICDNEKAKTTGTVTSKLCPLFKNFFEHVRKSGCALQPGTWGGGAPRCQGARRTGAPSRVVPQLSRPMQFGPRLPQQAGKQEEETAWGCSGCDTPLPRPPLAWPALLSGTQNDCGAARGHEITRGVSSKTPPDSDQAKWPAWRGGLQRGRWEAPLSLGLWGPSEGGRRAPRGVSRDRPR